MSNPFDFSEAFKESFFNSFMTVANEEAELFSTVCESPIEVQFAVCFTCISRFVRFDNYERRNETVRSFHGEIEGDHSDATWTMCIQKKIGKYRVDFEIKLTGSDRVALVECDGRNFHHATHEQIHRDRIRDRELETDQNIKVFRFPGTQIWNDPVSCVAAVSEWLAGGLK